MSALSGGQLVVRVLEEEGVRHVFCVPGESYLGVLDGLFEHPSIQLISNRHEGGAAFMAEAYAKASGSVGVCMATRGVGTSNLAIGLHTARQDSTPLVALVGQVERPFRGREAFQEVDLVAAFRPICKDTLEIDRAERIPELLHRAFYTARSGRPGPVLVALPHDMLEDMVERTANGATHGPNPVHRPVPASAAVQAALDMLTIAKRPVILAGGGIALSQSTAALVTFAERWEIPVTTAFRRFDTFPNTHRNYAGWLGFGPAPHVLTALRESDLVLVLGSRLSQVTTQDYTLLPDGATVVQVDIDPDSIGKVYPPALGIPGDVGAFLDMANDLPISASAAQRRPWVEELHAAYTAFSTPPNDRREDMVDLDGFMVDVRRLLPADAIVTSDAGNFFGWVLRYLPFTRPTSYLGPTSGAMGYGMPAAIGAKLAHPEAPVVSFSGDGGFMMTIQELETAVRYNIPFVAVVVNNNLYGTIRAHQERHFPGRVVGTPLGNPNYSQLAESFGAYGVRVTRNRDFAEAFTTALQCGRPAVVEVLTDPEILSVSQRKPSRQEG